MPKVHKVVARKDYPQHGVLKGQTCYVWSLKTGPRSSREFRQLTPPKRSQLTNSDFLQQAYELDDQIDAATEPGDLESIAEEFRNLGQEQQDKLDNMPEGLQQGPTGEMLQERIDQCESVADSLETAASEWEQALGEVDEESEDATVEEQQEEARENALQSIDRPF